MTEAELRSLGRAVRGARKRVGLRQRDLARQLGVGVFFLHCLEQGKYKAVFPSRYAAKVEAVRRWLRDQEEGGGHG